MPVCSVQAMIECSNIIYIYIYIHYVLYTVINAITHGGSEQRSASSMYTKYFISRKQTYNINNGLFRV